MTTYKLTKGDRVCGGEEGTEDFDTGRIVDIKLTQALVAWDSGVTTWTPRELLYPGWCRNDPVKSAGGD